MRLCRRNSEPCRCWDPHHPEDPLALLTLHTSRDPRRLLEAAADGFLTPRREGGSPYPSPDYFLVLRQGGLRDDLIAFAAERRIPGWFDPPIALFTEVHQILADLRLPAIGDFERVVLVARALRSSAGPVFQRIRDIDAYADAADRWFGELIAEGIGPDDLGAGRAPTDRFAVMRDAELSAAYREYMGLLAGAGRRDPRARLVDTAAALRAAPADLPRGMGGRREVRVVGLADPRGGWIPLIEALESHSAIERVRIYAAEPLAFVADRADEVFDLDPAPHFAARMFDISPSVGSTAPPPSIDLVSAPDLPREVEEVAARVRALLEGGTPPHRVAVVARSARPYVGHVLRALERVGVPATARRRYALPEVPAVRTLLALFRVAAEGWERLGLVELAETPYFRANLDAGVLNHIGYQRRLRGLDAWQAAIEELARQAAEREARLELDPDDEEARRNPLPAHARVARTLERFQEFAVRARALNQRRSVAEWLAWLDAFVADDPWRLERTLYRVPAGRLETVRLDTVAWRGVRRILAEWASAEGRWGGEEPLSVVAFEARLRAMLDGDAAVYTPTRRGVQVLEGLAASFRSFDRVFIVGLDSGNVPLRPPRSPLVDEHDRRALREAGLRIDTAAEWQERERALFLSLISCASAGLTLSFARYDESGAEQLPSPFFEEVEEVYGADVEVLPGSRAFTPGVPLARTADGLRTAVIAASAELQRAADAHSPYHGIIEDAGALAWLVEQMGEDRIWSPTQIEAYAKCPWSYFSSRLLRLENLEDPDLDMDALTRGAILHDALRRFYEAAVRHADPPIYLRSADLVWARPLADQAVEAAIEHARESAWVGHPALAAQRLAELRRQLIAYIEWEALENDDAIASTRKKIHKLVRTGVVEHERSFDDVELEVDGERVRFRGFIDRVERGVDERGGSENLVAAVDYKSSTWSTPASGKNQGWDDGVVLQVPLYAYALTRILDGVEAARVEYRSIRNRERVHELSLYRYEKGQLVEDTNARERYERALADVVRHVRSAREGVFPPRPPASCNCPPFCHARDICRIPGGPRGMF